jgi:hypothetical protein
MSDAADDLFSRALTYTAVGGLCLARGKFPGAISALRSLVLCERVPIFFPWTAACLGYVHALTGQIADGLPLIEQAVADDRVQRGGARLASAAGTLQVLVLARLGEGCLLAGRMDEALHWTCETLVLSNQLKMRGTEACALRLLGEIASHRAPPRLRPQNSITARGSRCRAGHASAYRPLPPRPRQTLSPRGQRRPGSGAPHDRGNHVPRNGHDILAGAGGGGNYANSDKQWMSDRDGPHQ